MPKFPIFNHSAIEPALGSKWNKIRSHFTAQLPLAKLLGIPDFLHDPILPSDRARASGLFQIPLGKGEKCRPVWLIRMPTRVLPEGNVSIDERGLN